MRLFDNAYLSTYKHLLLPMKVTALIVLFILPLFSFCQDSMATHYKIYNTAKKAPATLNDIINDMAKADVLFFGEEHNDSTGHILEYLVFKKLSEKYPGKAALSMEMF